MKAKYNLALALTFSFTHTHIFVNIFFWAKIRLLKRAQLLSVAERAEKNNKGGCRNMGVRDGKSMYVSKYTEIDRTRFNTGTVYAVYVYVSCMCRVWTVFHHDRAGVWSMGCLIDFLHLSIKKCSNLLKYKVSRQMFIRIEKHRVAKCTRNWVN